MMGYWKAAVSHFKTITTHKLLVMRNCFKLGLYKQGLLHDLSKYSPEEFMVGVKYFQGNKSPNAAERDDIGYSTAWMHHKGRNKHHYEYWVDMAVDKQFGSQPVKMPLKYVAEMLADRIAACMVYEKDKYTDASALAYYEKSQQFMEIHPETKALLEKLLRMLAEKGEDYTFRYVRHLLSKKTY